MTDPDIPEMDFNPPGEDDKPKKGRRGRKKSEEETHAPSGLSHEDAGRMKALETTLGDLTKRYGDGTIVRRGDAQHMAVEVIPTGSLGIDICMGVGGVPRGRITEMSGPESSGNTTICLSVIAEAQKRGGLQPLIAL